MTLLTLLTLSSFPSANFAPLGICHGKNTRWRAIFLDGMFQFECVCSAKYIFNYTSCIATCFGSALLRWNLCGCCCCHGTRETTFRKRQQLCFSYLAQSCLALWHQVGLQHGDVHAIQLCLTLGLAWCQIGMQQMHAKTHLIFTEICARLWR